MNDEIREESGLLLLRRPGYHLLNVEPLVQSRAGWDKLKVPEIVHWNVRHMLLVEVKGTIPRKEKNKAEIADIEELEEKLQKLGYRLTSRLRTFCDSVREKYTTVLLALRPDVVGTFLKDLSDEQLTLVDAAAQLRNLHLNNLESILLLLIIPDAPTELLPALQDTLSGSICEKITPWQPNCEFKVLNAQGATFAGLSRMRGQ